MAESADLLRMYLGEIIPEGGSDEDTMFTDGEIQNFLDTVEQDPLGAAALGWDVKAANLAHLVDMAEGSSRRSLSQRFEHAVIMAKHYAALAGVDSSAAFSKPTKIHQIERS